MGGYFQCFHCFCTLKNAIITKQDGEGTQLSGWASALDVPRFNHCRGRSYQWSSNCPGPCTGGEYLSWGESFSQATLKVPVEKAKGHLRSAWFQEVYGFKPEVPSELPYNLRWNSVGQQGHAWDNTGCWALDFSRSNPELWINCTSDLLLIVWFCFTPSAQDQVPFRMVQHFFGQDRNSFVVSLKACNQGRRAI